MYGGMFFKETKGQNLCLFLTKNVELEQKKSHKNSPKLHIFKSGFRALSAMLLFGFIQDWKKIPETSQKNILHQLTLNTLDRIRRAAFLSSFFDQGILESVLLFVWSSFSWGVLCTKQHGSKPSLWSWIRFWSSDSQATNWKQKKSIQ